MAFTLPNLPYEFAALEPHIDARTMEIHHDKHHAAYVNNLNAAIQGTEHEGKSIEELLANISKLPPAVRNNGGGHWNHSMFWEIMAPNAGGNPSGDLASKIDKNFGSFDEMKKTVCPGGYHPLRIRMGLAVCGCRRQPVYHVHAESG